MATGDRKVDIYLKKFLPQQQITENFFDYLERQINDTMKRLFTTNGVFIPNIDGVNIFSSSAPDTFDIVTPLEGTDGTQGNQLILDPGEAAQVPFENESGVDYYVGLRFNLLPRETEVNVRTGELKYVFLEQSVGELGEPDLVVDDGDETLTLNVDSICEPGVTHAGRKCVVYLKQAQSQAQAFEELDVIWDGTNNKIETTTALGQTIGSISTDPSDYQVFLRGPTIRRNTDLRLDDNLLFIGVVTGAGAGNSPTVFDQTDVNNFSLGLAGIIGLFDIEHSLVDGSHTTITAETISTKQSITGVQLDTQVNASDEDSPSPPVAHTLFPSSGGSGLQAVKWRLRDSSGATIAFVDSHGNAYFQSLSAIQSVFQSNVIVEGDQLIEGDSVLGDNIASDTVTFNSILQSLTDMFYVIDSDDDGTGHAHRFFNHDTTAPNELFRIEDTGDGRSTRDSLTQSGSAYLKPSTGLPATGVDASLNEVYDQTRFRDLLKVTPNNPANTVVNISPASLNIATGEQFGLVENGSLLGYPGGSINFATGVIVGGGSNFPPFIPPSSGQFFKYGVILINDEIVVIAPSASDVSPSSAPNPNLAGGIPIAIITVQDNGIGGAGTINPITETSIVRFGASAGGGAGGGGGGGGSGVLGERARAFGFSDNSTTLFNMQAPVVTSGKTQVQLDFQINPTDIVEVHVNKLFYPRFIDNATTPSMYWNQIDNDKIEFDSDITAEFGQGVPIEVRVFAASAPTITPTALAGLEKKGEASGNTDGVSPSSQIASVFVSAGKTVIQTIFDILPDDIVFVYLEEGGGNLEFVPERTIENSGVSFPIFYSRVDTNKIELSADFTTTNNKAFFIQTFQGQSTVDKFGNVCLKLKANIDSIFLESPSLQKFIMTATNFGELNLETTPSGIVVPLRLERRGDNQIVGFGVSDFGELIIDDAPTGGILLEELHIVSPSGLAFKMEVTQDNELILIDGFNNLWKVTTDIDQVLFQINELIQGSTFNTRYFDQGVPLPTPPSVANTVPWGFRFDGESFLPMVWQQDHWEDLAFKKDLISNPDSIFSIGETRTAFMTEPEFQAKNGSNWVEMRGQTIPVSEAPDLATLRPDWVQTDIIVIPKNERQKRVVDFFTAGGSGTTRFPPAGFTMDHLEGTTVSNRFIFFAGGVDGNDTLRATYSVNYTSGNISYSYFNSEQRASGQGNIIIHWAKKMESVFIKFKD